MVRRWSFAGVLGVVLCGSVGFAQTQSADLAQTIAGLVDGPEVARDHWGIAVVGMDGTPIYSLHEGQLFQPASTAKLFTTAAAMALLGPISTVTTTVNAVGVFSGKEHLKGNLYLGGSGDANLSGRGIPYAPDTEEAFPPLHVLDNMAAQVAQTGLKTVDGDVIGLGYHLPYQPYPEGWSEDDLTWGYGAPVSMLSVNDNELKVTITPDREVGSRAGVEISPVVPYYTVVNDVMTVAAKSQTRIGLERMPGTKQLRLFGRIAVRSSPQVEHIAIEDPAEFAAIAFKQLLEQHGVTASGRAVAEHVLPEDTRGFRDIVGEPLDLAKASGLQRVAVPGLMPCPGPCDPQKAPRSVVLASHVSPTLSEDVVLTNKLSVNLHAELLLLRLGDRFTGGQSGNSFAEGARVVRQFLLDAGISGDDFVFYDGSGLSTYDLVTPRAMVRLLQYASGQSWFTDWKASLPVGGVDGTLERRFTKAPLKGRVIAKTGTMGESRALGGYVECASGRTVIFSIMVGNHLPGTNVDRDVMDKVVAAIAAAN
jgi:serine-type D-Ala-D-Ala carboxypeptidase/endopeptidase (penicillin-binding protein 4)